MAVPTVLARTARSRWVRTNSAGAAAVLISDSPILCIRTVDRQDHHDVPAALPKEDKVVHACPACQTLIGQTDERLKFPAGVRRGRSTSLQGGDYGWSAGDPERPSGSSASTVVSAPGAVCTWSRPPSASTRSLSPTSPDPPPRSAPPRPSSRTRTRTAPSTVSTSTSTLEARACLATLASASDTR